MAADQGARAHGRPQSVRRRSRARGTGLTGASGAAAAPGSIAAQGWGWRHAGRLAWACRNLDLRIEPGERVLLLGASGSGKSTLLRAIAGVLGADEGESEGSLLVEGHELFEGQGAVASRGRVGLVQQDPDSQVVLSRVGDDVAFGCENLGVPTDEIWPRVRNALDAVGLAVPLDRSTSALSGGQRQRLAIAGALCMLGAPPPLRRARSAGRARAPGSAAMRPGILLLDEPTANLDPAGVADVRDAVGRVLDATGATLIVVEHRVAVWQGLIDRVIVLSPDGVLADGAPDDVLDASLAARGIWVPDFPPPRPVRRARAEPEVVESSTGLAVGRNGIAVQRGLDVTVRSSRLLAITGPNGVGKSTLGLTLAGLLPPVEGTVTALGRPDPHRWKSRDLLTRIGTVFQDPEHQFLATTVRAELEVGPRALGTSLGVVDELLERLRLGHLAKANPFTLSGGEQRRLSVATVLATAPRILVLDEPTFGQDALTWAEMVAIIAGLVDGGAAVVTMTHDLDLVDALADDRMELS